jgi:hypothetical protein
MNSTHTDYRKRLTLQGFGLSFLLSAVLFLISGDPISFTVVLLGLILGFGLGNILDRRALASPVNDLRNGERSEHPIGVWFRRLYLNESILVRIAVLLASGAVLLALAWISAYYLLPERLLQTGAPAGEGAAESLLLEWSRIAGYNLIMLAAIALIGLLLPQYPFAYLVPLVWCVFYGILLGTNSFVVPMPERMAPSLSVFQRAGPYEMAAFLLVAAATYSPARRVADSTRRHFLRSVSRAQWVSFGLGFLIILLAAAWEANMIVSAAG